MKKIMLERKTRKFYSNSALNSFGEPLPDSPLHTPPENALVLFFDEKNSYQDQVTRGNDMWIYVDFKETLKLVRTKFTSSVGLNATTYNKVLNIMVKRRIERIDHDTCGLCTYSFQKNLLP